MSKRLAIILLLIVLVPLGLLGWLGSKLAQEENERIRASLEGVMRQRLLDMDQRAKKVTGDIERDVLGFTKVFKGIPGTERLRDISRNNRFIRQVFVRRPDKSFQHPPLGNGITQQERDFFERTDSIWKSGIEFHTPANDVAQNLEESQVTIQDVQQFDQQEQQQIAQVAAPKQQLSWDYAQSVDRYQWSARQVGEHHGWHAWFWSERVNFLLWRQISNGYTLGAELETTALISELIAQLPANSETDGDPDVNIRLMDASGRELYQWGKFDPSEAQDPKTELILSAPLQMWKLQYFTNSDPVGSGALPFHITASLFAVGIGLVGLAIYFYLENTRELRVASQRVSFVNQVSHELKTPLTNIRMYAELMEGQLPEEDIGPRKHLKVITDESRRLSRLIANVLTFGRSQREELQLHKSSRSPDKVVQAVLENFRPALKTREFEIEIDLDAPESMQLDADILEQILGNLISNVEKYGSNGKYLGITTNQKGDTLEIRVEDKGPGIPENQRHEVFVPFHRLGNDLSEGVSGTGIGLPIARDLARLHGGDLTILDTKVGATFLLTLKS